MSLGTGRTLPIGYGLNDATRALVEQHQPFMNTDPTIHTYLWMLQQLSNTDKHRLLNLITVTHDFAAANFSYTGGKTTLTGEHLLTQIDHPKFARLEDGAEYFAFWTKEPFPADAKVYMNTEIALDVLFGDATPVADGQSVFQVIEGIGKWVIALRNDFIRLNPKP